MTVKIVLRVDLDEESSRMFDAVKRDRGLKQNTEVVRSLIRDAYRTIQSLTPQVEQEVS